jgi:undecaprenyl-diphosphatase
MHDFDLLLTQFINAPAGQHPWFDQVMIAVSVLGVPFLVAMVALQWWRHEGRPFVRHVLLASGLSFLLGLGLNQIILLFLHRARPYDVEVSHLLIAPSADWSMPSDHATASMAIAATFLLHGMSRVGATFLVVALLLAYSRVYVGIHYAGDVAAGGLTGILAALVVWALYKQDTRLDRLVTGIF